MGRRNVSRMRAVGSPEDGLVREMVGGKPYDYRPLGNYVVCAVGVCGGEPTFKYTRIDARFIVERIQAGETPEDLVAAYGGRISSEAVEEALHLDAEGLLEEPAVTVLRTA